MIAKLSWALILACSTLPLFAAQPGDEGFNPYAESYVSRLPAPAAPNKVPRLHSGSDKVQDYYRLLEDGYDMLGYSSFEFGDVAPEKLRQHATRLGADIVLVYTQGVDSLARRQARKGGVEPAPGENGTRYEYFATYWVKLPPPLLGLHVQREHQEADTGLEVLAVVKHSPAAMAGFRRGDVLTGVGTVTVHHPEQLSREVRRWAGKSVEVIGRRDGTEFRSTVTLNRPQLP